MPLERVPCLDLVPRWQFEMVTGITGGLIGDRSSTCRLAGRVSSAFRRTARGRDWRSPPSTRQTAAATSAGATTSRFRHERTRIAVGVSGAGSNLRALATAAGAASSVAGSSSSSPIVPARRSTGRRSRGSTPRWSRAATTARWRRRSRRPGADVVVLAGYMRIVGPAVLAAFGGPDPQHASVAAAGVPGCARGRRRARARASR